MLGLRASTPVVEDDQDIGESNASVTINIGGAVILTEIKVRHCSNGIIDVVVPITVDITIHVGVHGSASAETGFSLVGIIRTVVDTVCCPVTIGVSVFVPASTSSGIGLVGIVGTVVYAIVNAITISI